MEDMKNLLLEKAEELGWTVEESVLEHNRLFWEFSKTSNAGEDFGFGVSGNTPEELVQDVQSYYEGFDAEEHASSWAAYFYGKSGNRNLRVLLDDADKIDRMVSELADALEDVVQDWYLTHDDEEEENS